MDWFDELLGVMARLRAPDGCPWDREQTHRSLRPYLLEETYEALEAVDAEDWPRLSDELGDVLLQVVFHAQLASERGDFDIAEVCRGIVTKLKRRHPHVFADSVAETPDEVIDRWEKIKREEDGYQERESAVDGIPEILPALQRAYKLQKRASRVGFDWPEVSGPRAKVDEELREVDEATGDALEHEVGDLLFAVVNLARFLDVEPEWALRRANERFARRFRSVEEQAGGSDGLSRMDLEEMDVLWERAKAEEA
ncbi:MAG TPA: nucleoside triphosphate pyrophosphohydrolase [Armatimonadetes bacterium]|nr:nucleoside triphosphate pyrophosphohydrolase [Armatimonadota bacterium]